MLNEIQAEFIWRNSAITNTVIPNAQIANDAPIKTHKFSSRFEKLDCCFNAATHRCSLQAFDAIISSA